MNVLKSKILDLHMTLIIATIGEDGIVITADGLAPTEGEDTAILNYEKIRKIKDGVYIGVAATNISNTDFDRLIKESNEVEPSYPYTIVERGKEFSELASKILKMPVNQGVQFILAGYDKDENKKSTTANIYKITQSNIGSFNLEEKFGLQELSIGFNKLDKAPIPLKTEQLKKYERDVIKRIYDEKRSYSVGLPHRTIIIKQDKIESSIK